MKEAVAASALRRAARTGEDDAVARVCDLPVVLPTLLGKIEFEMGEEGRERAVLDHLLRLAVAATFRDRLGGLDLGRPERFEQLHHTPLRDLAQPPLRREDLGRRLPVRVIIYTVSRRVGGLKEDVSKSPFGFVMG